VRTTRIALRRTGRGPPLAAFRLAAGGFRLLCDPAAAACALAGLVPNFLCPRATHRQRLRRLDGLPGLERLVAPAGLDLGGTSPAETALFLSRGGQTSRRPPSHRARALRVARWSSTTSGSAIPKGRDIYTTIDETPAGSPPFAASSARRLAVIEPVRGSMHLAFSDLTTLLISIMERRAVPATIIVYDFLHHDAAAPSFAGHWPT
jgi:hypothetical protein